MLWQVLFSVSEAHICSVRPLSSESYVFFGHSRNLFSLGEGLFSVGPLAYLWDLLNSKCMLQCSVNVLAVRSAAEIVVFKIGNLLSWYTCFEPSGRVIWLSHYFSCGGRSQDLWVFDGHWETAERLNLPFTEHSSSLYCLETICSVHHQFPSEARLSQSLCISPGVGWRHTVIRCVGDNSPISPLLPHPLFLGNTLMWYFLFSFPTQKNLHPSLAHCVIPLIWECTSKHRCYFFSLNTNPPLGSGTKNYNISSSSGFSRKDSSLCSPENFPVIP